MSLHHSNLVQRTSTVDIQVCRLEGFGDATPLNAFTHNLKVGGAIWTSNESVRAKLHSPTVHITFAKLFRNQ